jgi:hypothetical protein
MGGGQYRTDADVLSVAAAASQESEVDQSAGTFNGRDQTAHAGGADFPQRIGLPAAGSTVFVAIFLFSTGFFLGASDLRAVNSSSDELRD